MNFTGRRLDRRCTRWGSFSTFLAGVALVSTFSDRPASGAPTPGGPVKVVIDPGHGGSDPGAVGNGIVEKAINLRVALRLKELLELDTVDLSGGGSWDVRLTRSSDTFVSLAGRVAIANSWGADLFVSIHHNGFSSPAANGTETFSFASGTQSAGLRDRIQSELLAAHGLANRGSKTASFYVLRETLMPAALSEAGFVTSPFDATVLTRPGADEAAARAHLFALQRHVGATPHVPGAGGGATTYCTPKISSLFCVPTIRWTGTPSLANSDFRILCDDVVSQQFGMLIWSRSEAAVPFFGGTLCVGGSIVRTQVRSSSGLTPGNCTGGFAEAIDSAFLHANGFAPGDELFAQWWYRDPGSPEPVGLSGGLRFTVLP